MDQQSRHQALRAYCPNIYTVVEVEGTESAEQNTVHRLQVVLNYDSDARILEKW